MKKTISALRSGITWQYVTVVVQAAAQLVVLTVLSRLLPPEDFGIASAAMVIVGFAALFGQLGVAPAVIQVPTLTIGEIRSAFTISVFTGAVLFGAVSASANHVSEFFDSDVLVDVIRWIAWVFPLAGFGSVAEALLQRGLRFREWTTIHLASYICGYAAVAIMLAWSGAGVWSLVAGTLAQRLIQSAASYAIVRHSIVPRFVISEYRKLLHFGIGYTVAQTLNYVANQADYAIVGKLFDATGLGIYSRAYNLMMLPARYLGQALDRVLFPVMAQLQGNSAALRRLYVRSTAVVNMIAAAVAALMIVLAPEIVLVLLGGDWNKVTVPFQILTVGAIFRTSYKISDSLAKAVGAVYRRSVREGVYAALVIIGSLVGAGWGLAGVAVGVLVAIIGNYLYASLISNSKMGVTWLEFVDTLTGAVVMGTVTTLSALLLRWWLANSDINALLIVFLTTAASAALCCAIAVLAPMTLGRACGPMLLQMRRRMVGTILRGLVKLA